MGWNIFKSRQPGNRTSTQTHRLGPLERKMYEAINDQPALKSELMNHLRNGMSIQELTALLKERFPKYESYISEVSVYAVAQYVQAEDENSPAQEEPVKGGFFGDFFGGKKKEQATEPEERSLAPEPEPAIPALEKVDAKDLNLVDYTPEQLLKQVNDEANKVEFKNPWNIKLMSAFGSFWSIIGPLCLLVGTIGEIVVFLSNRQIDKSWYIIGAIIAVSIAMEGTFLGVSYQAASIRYRGEKRPTGPTKQERDQLTKIFWIWLALAIGICITQVAFVVAHTQTDAHFNEVGVWTLAIFRSVFTCIADSYTAFFHHEPPTSDDVAIAVQEKKREFAEKLLEQKNTEITSINNRVLALRAAHSEAEIKQDTLVTELELKRMENKNRIAQMQASYENTAIFDQMRTNIMRALFDPRMPDEDRSKMIETMKMLGQAAQMNTTTIKEIEPPEMKEESF